MSGFYLKWLFNISAIQDNTNRLLGLTQGWPGALNIGNPLIEVEITVIKRNKCLDLEKQPLNNKGWPLNMVLLNTGSTI